jgi:hypothetical protein
MSRKNFCSLSFPVTPMLTVRIRSERDPQPFLTFEQHAKRYGDLPMPIALVARVG